VSAAAPTRSGGARRAAGVTALVAATLVAAGAGAAIGSVLAPGGTEPPAAEAPPRIGLRNGVARLPLPVGWEPLGRRSSLRGFEQATAVRGEQSRVALDLRAPEDASLLPAGVAADSVPDPRPQRLGVRTWWRYDLPGLVVALALPTTGGVVTIACGSTPDAIAAATTECEQAAQSVQLVGASALVPAPETAAAIVLPDAVAQLNRRRRLQRRHFAATYSPVRRSAAARRIARGYADAAARLRPLAAGNALRVTAALDALERRHRALATASRRRHARTAGRIGAAIERDERRLGSLLTAVTRAAG